MQSADPPPLPVVMRFRLLGDLALGLHALGRSSTLVLRVTGQPVLYVRVASGLRMLPVVGVRGDGDRWAFLWDGDQWAPADGIWLAARQIAGVIR